MLEGRDLFTRLVVRLFDFIKDNLERILELENTLSIVLMYV